MMAERYTDVVIATKSHAACCGVNITVDHSPAAEFEPFVLSYTSESSQDDQGIILLFPPSNINLTSDEIVFIVDRIRQAEEEGKQVWLLFSDETLARVRKILQASGIANHAETITYKRKAKTYEMDWSLS